MFLKKGKTMLQQYDYDEGFQVRSDMLDAQSEEAIQEAIEEYCEFLNEKTEERVRSYSRGIRDGI